MFFSVLRMGNEPSARQQIMGSTTKTNGAGLTRAPFARSNANVTTPLFCACSPDPLGAYATWPPCADEWRTMRDPYQTVMFGPEVFNGYYGRAFLLRFPSYTGPMYQATIPAFNVPGAARNPNGPFVVTGSKTNPYFRVLNVQR